MKAKLFVIILCAGLFYSYIHHNPIYDMKDGLIAYFPFDGSAKDESGKGNDGIVHGAVLANDRNGKEKSAYFFNGNLSFIDIGNSPKIKRIANDYSVAGWICLQDYSNSYNTVILSNRNSETEKISGSLIGVGGLQSSLSKRIEFVQYSGQASNITTFEYMSSNTQLETGKWYFFCITYKYYNTNKNIVRIYINGMLESQKVMGATLDPLNIDTYMGCEPQLWPIDYSLNGFLDEIRIYNRVLTDTEISKLYELN